MALVRRLAIAGLLLAVAGSRGGDSVGPPPPVPDLSGLGVAAGAPPDGVAAGAVQVLAVGDIACAPGERVSATTCRHRDTARLARKLRPAYVIALGDLQYDDGELAHFRSEYHRTWGALRTITRPVPGNHEYHTRDAAGFYAYFGDRPPAYGTVSVPGWRILLLDSNCTEIDCARQETWLRRELTERPRRCTAIAMHHPRYSSGQHGSDPSMARFWRIAVEHRVDVALAGHDHDYERFDRMDADGHASARGILSFVSGTGGRSLYSMGRNAPGSQFFWNRQPGILQLWLSPGEFGWRFVTIDGEVRDSGTRSCI